MFEIHFSTKAKKDLDKIEERYKRRVAEVIRILMVDPIPTRLFDVKKLAGTENAFRIRIGKIRIVYTILWKDKVILISRIGFRGRVY